MNFSPIVKNREFIKSLSPALRYKSGDDFTAWQAVAREKLSELVGLQNFVVVEPKAEVLSTATTSEYNEYVIKLQTEADFYTTMTLRTPIGCADKIPLVVCPCGNSDDLAAMLATDTSSECAVAARMLEAGYAVLIVEQRSFDNCFAISATIPEEATTRTTWCACYRSSMRAAMLGRTTMGERVWDVMRAIDVALEYDFVDEDRIYLVGNSGCATVAYYTAAVDTRVAMVVASGGVASYEKSIMQRHHCVCNYIPYIVNYFEMGDIAGLIAPRGLAIIAGKADEWFPADGVADAYDLAKSAYAGASATEALKLYTPEGGHDLYMELLINAIDTLA